MSPTPQQQHDPFEHVAARAGAGARSATERLTVTTAALHDHRQQRNTRRGVALGGLTLAGVAVVALLVLDRPIDSAEVTPAVPGPSVSLADPPSGTVRPHALLSVGVSISPPPNWTLTEDPDIATFELSRPDGYRLTAMAFVPGSVVAADGTRHPVPQGLDDDAPVEGDDVLERAFAATRTDLTLGDTGGIAGHLGLFRWLTYQAPAGSPPLMCPEPPTATTCSVPPPGVDLYAELNTFRDDTGVTWAIIFYKDPQSPGPAEEIQSGELVEAFHRK